jgi:hypothetical protein
MPHPRAPKGFVGRTENLPIEAAILSTNLGHGQARRQSSANDYADSFNPQITQMTQNDFS